MKIHIIDLERVFENHHLPPVLKMAIRKTYDMAESPELPVKGWDVEGVLYTLITYYEQFDNMDNKKKLKVK